MQAVVIHAAKDLRIEERDFKGLRDGEVRVRIEFGGICGSDLHYFLHGGFGAVRLREPMILGHEISGVITQVGPALDGVATNLKTGDRVAVSPSRPCGKCRYCGAEKFNHCLDMRFYGSAMPMPHIQGAFRQELAVDAAQCHPISSKVLPQMAPFAEPLAVVLHAFERAGSVAGKSVLITGCGPIGALAVLVARAKGAAKITAVDILDPVLKIAETLGADHMINARQIPDWAKKYAKDKGSFDVMIEASGSADAVLSGLEVLRPQAVLVQLGLGGTAEVPLTAIAAREIEMRGAFRFHKEFAQAVAMINEGQLNLAPLLSATFGFREANKAFDLAADRTRSMKVQLDFS